MAETSLERILEQVETLQAGGAGGRLGADRLLGDASPRRPAASARCARWRRQLLFLAKGRGITTFLIGHVTKDGSLAGPKSLEHIVDTVLYFEGEKRQHHRIVRAVKNRFGAVSELGVFEMTGDGPAAGGQPVGAVPGRAARGLAGLGGGGHDGGLAADAGRGAGARLAHARSARRGACRSASTPTARTCCWPCSRSASGWSCWADDVFVSVAGGLEVDEPAADLGVAAAVASSFRNRPLPARTVVFGEVGLARRGARRPARRRLRVREAAQMGFTRCVCRPATAAAHRQPGAGRRRTLEEALEHLLG